MFHKEKQRFIKRRIARVLAFSGAEFLYELRRCVREFRNDAIIGSHADELLSEAVELLANFRKLEDELAKKLTELRVQLAALAPETADDTLPPDADMHFDSLRDLYRNFDKLVASSSALQLGETDEDETRGARLARILQTKIHAARWPHETNEDGTNREGSDRRPDLAPLSSKVGELSEHFRHSFREFVFEQSASPAVSFLRLVSEIDGMNPQPPKWADETESERLNRWASGLFNGAHSFRKALHGQGNEKENDNFERHVADLRGVVERVGDELEIRLLGQRSLIFLLERYKARCEWHDAKRLATIATRGPGKAEDRLVAQAALWLFDQGLNPITKPLTGNLEPDLLDPTSKPKLYVEAKRYKNSAELRKAVAGIRQVADTMQRLSHQPYRMAEAVLLVFRHGGPLLRVPRVVKMGDWKLLAVVVDLDPTSSGSKQQFDVVNVEESDIQKMLAAPMNQQNSKTRNNRRR